MQTLRFPFSGGTSVLCIGFLTLVHLQHSSVWSLPGSLTCKTTECERRTKDYLKNMNKKIKPCSDFYEYVCNRWGSENPRPKHEEMWNVQKVMHLNALQNLRKLLNGMAESNLNEEKIAKSLYQRCRDAPFLDRKTPGALNISISKAVPLTTLHFDDKEALGNLTWWQVERDYIYWSGESAFFDFHFNAELDGDNRMITVINRPYSPYGALKRFTGWNDQKELKHYKSFLITIIRSLITSSPAPSVEALEKTVDAVIKFREELRTLPQPPKSTREPIIIPELQETYDKMLRPTQQMAKITWIEFLKGLHRSRTDPKMFMISKRSLVKPQLDYFAQLADVLGRTPKRVIVNHCHLYFAERHIELTPQMKADLERSYTDSAHSTGKIRHEPEQWQKCIESSNTRVAMTRMYNHAYFPEKIEIAVKRLVEDVKRVLAQQISESLWLDAATKNLTINKIKGIIGQIGGPNWYIVHLKKTEKPADNVNPMNVEVFYSSKSNMIFVSAAYLQSPIYSPNLPFVIDYGATVSLLAHEIYHEFVSRGISHPDAGIVSSWSPAMRTQFGVRLNCFKNQYRAYREKEFRAHGLPVDLLYRAPDTLDEDMADVMGLKLAYKAYQQKVQQNNGTCPVMRDFEKLGCDKLFFIAFANDFCSASTSSSNRHFLLNDVHSSPRVRVNGAVANLEEFSQVFGCTDKDPLKLERTCDLWK